MSKLDKIKEGFGILGKAPKETKEVQEEPKAAVATAVKEESVEEEVQRYFNETTSNSKDLLQTTNETKASTNDGRNILINHSQRIRIYEPTKFNDVQLIGAEVKNGKIVIVNFKNLDEDEAIRVENFIYGMCYHADIAPESVHDGIISIDPQHKPQKK